MHIKVGKIESKEVGKTNSIFRRLSFVWLAPLHNPTFWLLSTNLSAQEYELFFSVGNYAQKHDLLVHPYLCTRFFSNYGYILSLQKIAFIFPHPEPFYQIWQPFCSRQPLLHLLFLSTVVPDCTGNTVQFQLINCFDRAVKCTYLECPSRRHYRIIRKELWILIHSSYMHVTLEQTRYK
jgi:hypothetical protein